MEQGGMEWAAWSKRGAWWAPSRPVLGRCRICCMAGERNAREMCQLAAGLHVSGGDITGGGAVTGELLREVIIMGLNKRVLLIIK